MRVEMLRARAYRGEHLDAGVIIEMDAGTAREFIVKGWAKEAGEAAPVAPATVEEAAPIGVKRRKALR